MKLFFVEYEVEASALNRLLHIPRPSDAPDSFKPLSSSQALNCSRALFKINHRPFPFSQSSRSIVQRRNGPPTALVRSSSADHSLGFLYLTVFKLDSIHRGSDAPVHASITYAPSHTCSRRCAHGFNSTDTLRAAAAQTAKVYAQQNRMSYLQR